MKYSEENTIGIVGGMGPHSGSALFNHILEYTKAERDQDHHSIILMSYPSWINDRSEFLDGKNPINPAYAVAEVIDNLERAGSKVVGMACNTVYAPEIYNVILKELSINNSKVKLLHMPYEVCVSIKKEHPFIRKVGLLATNGSYKSGVYETILKNLGLEVITPSYDFQNDIVHRMIYDPKFGIKASPNHIKPELELLWKKTLNFFRKEGTQALILGCTEFSLLFNQKPEDGFEIIDSLKIFSKALIKEAKRPNHIAISA